MNGEGRIVIPFQLDPLDKSDPVQMFRRDYGISQRMCKNFGDDCSMATRGCKLTL